MRAARSSRRASSRRRGSMRDKPLPHTGRASRSPFGIGAMAACPIVLLRRGQLPPLRLRKIHARGVYSAVIHRRSTIFMTMPLNRLSSGIMRLLSSFMLVYSTFADMTIRQGPSTCLCLIGCQVAETECCDLAYGAVKFAPPPGKPSHPFSGIFRITPGRMRVNTRMRAMTPRWILG